ncbi:MAG: hypothetical protein KC646_02225 [Candidatus Cloacimonetes bacterium]|nr:hypothetical protein [Candidatus Cloacimonadota bacterium]
MSHTYRISRKETIRNTVKVNEEWKSLIETLPILPQVEMAKLLSEELAKENDWSKSGNVHQKQDGNWTIEYDEESMLLSIEYDDEKTFEREETIEISGYNPGYSDEPLITSAIERAKEKFIQESTEAKDYEKAAKNKLEQEIEPKLDEIEGLFQDLVEVVQIEALKKKARNIGEIESIAEDKENGEVKIIVKI